MCFSGYPRCHRPQRRSDNPRSHCYSHITFTSTSSGTKTATVLIDQDVCPSGPYVFSVQASKGKSLTGVLDSVVVYPNPTKGVFDVILEGFKIGEVDIRIMDAAGKYVKSLKSMVGGTIHRIPLSVANLSSGVYTLEIRQGDKVRHLRIVKY